VGVEATGFPKAVKYVKIQGEIMVSETKTETESKGKGKKTENKWQSKSKVPWLPTDLSPSRLAKYLGCPAAYEYYYIQRLRPGDRDYFLMGNILDEVVMEEFRHDMGQDIDALVQFAGDELYARMVSSTTLTKFDGESKFSPEEMMNVVVDYRTWVRSFLNALQNGEDSSGRKVNLPVISDSQVEAFWTVNIDGQDVRLRGFADFTHEDGSVTDLKMASDMPQVIWTQGRIMNELQWVIYSMGLNTNKFRYLVMDKKKRGRGGSKVAAPCEVRILPVDILPKDVENVKKKISLFLRGSDFLNGHKNGVFPPTPWYNGVATKWNSRPASLQLTQNNFCQSLCDYKEKCFKEHFSGEHRTMTEDGNA